MLKVCMDSTPFEKKLRKELKSIYKTCHYKTNICI